MKKEAKREEGGGREKQREEGKIKRHQRSNLQFKTRLLTLHLRHRLVALGDPTHIVLTRRDQNMRTDDSNLLLHQISSQILLHCVKLNQSLGKD